MAHFCKNCGLLTAPYDERCPKCGAPLPHIPMGEALLESMRQSPEGTVETGEPLYEQDLEEERIDAMSQGATTAAMLLFAIPIAGFVLAVVWSFGGTQDPARRRLARAYLIRALVVEGWSSCLWLWPRWCLPPRCTASWPTTITVEEAP